MTKFQEPNSKYQTNPKGQIPNGKLLPNKYDLSDRTYLFAKNVMMFCKKLPQNILIRQYVVQAIRASGSVGANYIEANESLGRKDFFMRIKICRKEAKESAYWLMLIAEIENNNIMSRNALCLATEARELTRIFSSIVLQS